MSNSKETTLKDRFFEPLIKALENSKLSRSCLGYSDEDHLRSGIGRVFKKVSSGREWIQYIQAALQIGVSVRNFFLSLQSKRRLGLVQEVDKAVCQQADAFLMTHKNVFGAHPELDKFSIYATDGHTHKASAHETPIEGKKRPVTHLYSMNLKTHTMNHLAITTPQEGKKKEQELTTLKRQENNKMRMGQPKGTKVIHAYDPAIVDYEQWQKWKEIGVYIITLEKKNSSLDPSAYRSFTEHEDPRNHGVLSDERVIAFKKILLRRVQYKDPLSGKIYSFLTNEMTLPPGLIAFIYKMRWTVEKLYDQIKNKTMERKAWAKSEESKKQQAAFICLAHNLMIMLQAILDIEEGITDQKSIKKRKKRLEEDIQKAVITSSSISSLVLNYSRPSQRCCQFIRWLKNAIELKTSWTLAVQQLRPLMNKYLD